VKNSIERDLLKTLSNLTADDRAFLQMLYDDRRNSGVTGCLNKVRAHRARKRFEKF